MGNKITGVVRVNGILLVEMCEKSLYEALYFWAGEYPFAGKVEEIGQYAQNWARMDDEKVNGLVGKDWSELMQANIHLRYWGPRKAYP